LDSDKALILLIGWKMLGNQAHRKNERIRERSYNPERKMKWVQQLVAWKMILSGPRYQWRAQNRTVRFLAPRAQKDGFLGALSPNRRFPVAPKSERDGTPRRRLVAASLRDRSWTPLACGEEFRDDAQISCPTEKLFNQKAQPALSS